MLFLKFVLLCALSLDLSPNCLFVSGSKKPGNLKSKTGRFFVASTKSKGLPDPCSRLEQSVPTFMLNIFNNVKNKNQSAHANFVVRTFPGKSLPWKKPSVYFNLTEVKKSLILEKVKLYVLTDSSQSNKTQKVKAVLYDIHNGDKLSSRTIVLNESGWKSFEFRSVSYAMKWINNSSHNQGIKMKFWRGVKKLHHSTVIKLLPCIDKPWLTLYYYEPQSMVSEIEKRIFGANKRNQKNKT